MKMFRKLPQSVSVTITLVAACFFSAPLLSNTTASSIKGGIARQENLNKNDLEPKKLLAYRFFRASDFMHSVSADRDIPQTLFSPRGEEQDIDYTLSQQIDKLEKQRKNFNVALKDIYSGKKRNLEDLEHGLDDYPLLPYIKYHLMRHSISKISPQQIDQFILDNPDLPVAQFLKPRKLFSLARSQNWEDFLAYYSPVNNTRLNCFYHQAQFETKKRSAVLKDVKNLWLVGHSQPRECDDVFEYWISSEYFNSSIAWQRYMLALQNDKPSLAKYLIKHMPDKDKKLAKSGIDLYRNPQNIKQIKNPVTDKHKDLLNIALSRLISKDPELAKIVIQKQIDKDLSPKIQIASHINKLATIMAVRFHPDAENWLKMANARKTTPLLNELEIRTALRNLEWEKVRNKISTLPDKTAKSDRWRYWFARALKQTQKKKAPESEQIFQDLSKKRSFYGYLARNGESKFIHSSKKSKLIDEKHKALINDQVNVKRAREFHVLGQHAYARREWKEAIRAFTPSQRLVAAELAHEWDGPSLAIRAANAAKSYTRFDLRFPVGFENEVSKYASKHQLDQELIFALIRQESLFTPDARSHAGALGVMQILPSTAKSVAKEHNISYRGSQDLLNPNTNIRLGTAYLKQILNMFDNNEVLAMAAYNAGPHRVTRWLPEKSLPLDIWIETIPYKETRNYVKHLIKNQDIYREQLGINIQQNLLPEVINPG